MNDNISLHIKKDKDIYKLFARSDNGWTFIGVCDLEDKSQYNWNVKNVVNEINEVLGTHYQLRALLKETLEHTHTVKVIE